MDYPIITVEEFNFPQFMKIKTEVGKRGRQSYVQTKYFKNIITAFDIETTRLYWLNGEFITQESLLELSKEEQDCIETEAIMYIWQWHFDGIGTVIGRTWDEFKIFSKKLAESMHAVEKIVIYVHNLSHEFQYLRGIYNFQNDEIFATDTRQIVKCTMYDGHLEFRCSWKLTNMSLAQATKKYKVEHQKLDGDDFNYNIVRYPWTPLTEMELKYCVNDVVGLCEVVKTMLQMENDNLASIPMTSTGYVRREAKRAMRPFKFVIQELFPDYELYQELREAFRGGDTHANRFYADQTIANVKSYDRSSSYPDVMANCKFPMSKFFKVRQKTISMDELLDLIDRRGKAVLFRVAFTNLRLIDKFFGCPYFSESKCRHLEGDEEQERLKAEKAKKRKTKSNKKTDPKQSENTRDKKLPLQIDNGRVLSASYLETTLTDVDFEIVMNEYDFDDIVIFDVYHARYEELPKPYTDLIKNYYTSKTSLKGIEEKETEYEKEKNKFNALYGMMVQNPVIEPLIYKDFEFKPDESESAEELLEKYKKNAFIVYQWGVWVTAWARLRLHELIWIIGDSFVYCDTDSVKFVGEFVKDIEEYNKKRIADSTRTKSFAYDKKGKIHYMGVYENDFNYSEFKTLGAKKYAYRKEGSNDLHITISGVNKSKGAIELEECGGLDEFKVGFCFYKGGGKESIYNDIKEPFYRDTPEGEVEIIANMVLAESTYKLGMTEDYSSLVENSGILYKLIEAHTLLETGRRRHTK